MACLWAVAERTGGQDQSAIVDRVGLPGDVSQATPLVGNRLVSLQRSGEIAPNRVDIRQAEKGVGDARLVLDLASNRECLIEVTFRCDGFPCSVWAMAQLFRATACWNRLPKLRSVANGRVALGLEVPRECVLDEAPLLGRSSLTQGSDEKLNRDSQVTARRRRNCPRRAVERRYSR